MCVLSELSKELLVCFNIEDTAYIVGLLIYYFINVKILDFVRVFLDFHSCNTPNDNMLRFI